MKRIRRVTAVTLVGMIGVGLVAGIAGTASAAPTSTTTTGAGVSTTPPSSIPPTSSTAPTSSTPPSSSTTSPSSSTPPSNSTPSVKPKKSKKKGKKSKKKDVLTGPEIWRIVAGHQTINCAHSTRELKKVGAADAAISQRLGRWSHRSTVTPKSTGNNADKARTVKKAKQAKAMATKTGKRVKYFQKLEKKSTALINRIKAKCGAKTSTS